MKPESKFVYDWLKAHVEFFQWTYIDLTSWSVEDKITGENKTTGTFLVESKNSSLARIYMFKCYEAIDLKYVYRAILELEKSHSIKHKISEEDIRRVLNMKPNWVGILEGAT